MLEFVDWLIVSIRKFCTLLYSFGLVVSKLVLKLNFSNENNNYCNLPSRTAFLRVFMTFTSLRQTERYFPSQKANYNVTSF